MKMEWVYNFDSNDLDGLVMKGEGMSLREDADKIIKESIQKVMPDEAVRQALKNKKFDSGKVYVVSVGKAAWQMAKTAAEVLGDRIEKGICITKYDHVKSEIPRIKCYEAGHPLPDENSFMATEDVLKMVRNLDKRDTVIFLLSGGGSALFEKPLVSAEELFDVTDQLLSCGADIVEMNTIRKRLSAVKGGKFAKMCEPAEVYHIVLSDIIGDPLDMIASGPAYPDTSTGEQALKIVKKYGLKLGEQAMKLMENEPIKELSNVETIITGSVRNLCRAAEAVCQNLGYETFFLTDQLVCEAREAGRFFASIARSHHDTKKSLAFIAGGETVVHLTGQGKGGRNQELALSAAMGIAGLENTAIFSVGSDGTDGPTDAAGGYCDGRTQCVLEESDVDIYRTLQNNDAYHALEKTNGLIFTGATGTNVNDLTVLLIKHM
jgi:hydroxypyruvate reductase